MRQALVYCLVDPITNQIRYIGGTTQGIQIRLRQHIKTAMRKPYNNLRSSIWIRSLVTKGLKPRIDFLYICETLDYKYDEKIFIIACRALGCNLTNVSDGGQSGSPGRVISQLTRERLSKAQQGKKLSEDHKKNIGLSRIGIGKGIRFSEKRKKNISEALKEKYKSGTYRPSGMSGKNHSDATKLKMSLAKLGKT